VSFVNSDYFFLTHLQAVMVESPTFFTALHPVLSALQETNIDDFRLCKPIVHAQPLDPRPEVTSPEVLSIASGLDDSQRAAFIHCLTNKLAIIQGPPGTGKTFIGVKLVQALIKTGSGTPFLIVTYKNHALDEFLKHLITSSTVDIKEVVRIGSRSKEEMLSDCNIIEHCRQTKIYGKELYDIRNTIDELRDNVKNQSIALDEYSGLRFNQILFSLTEAQILSLLMTTFGQNHRVVKSIPTFQASHGSLVKMVRWVSIGQNTSSYDVKFFDEIRKALGKWLPDRKKLQNARNFQAKLLQKNPTEDGNEEDRFDEDDIRMMQEMRTNIFRGQTKDKIFENLVLLDLNQRTNICYRISDFPGKFRFESDIFEAVVY
jgi:hypothetical protein